MFFLSITHTNTHTHTQVLVLNYMGPMIRMAQEKEKGIKHALLLKGMSPLAFWLTWFISEGITVLLSSLISVSMIFACQLFVYTGAGWVFLGFLLFGMAYATFGFMCSFLADKAHTLAMFAALFNFLTLAAFGITQFYLINGNKVGTGVIYLLFLIAPVPFGHIMHEVIDTELWGKAWTPSMSPYGVAAYCFLAIDIVLYMALCLIFENFKDVFNTVGKKSAVVDEELGSSFGMYIHMYQYIHACIHLCM